MSFGARLHHDEIVIDYTLADSGTESARASRANQDGRRLANCAFSRSDKRQLSYHLASAPVAPR
jgi:hypothetical protein